MGGIDIEKRDKEITALHKKAENDPKLKRKLDLQSGHFSFLWRKLRNEVEGLDGETRRNLLKQHTRAVIEQNPYRER